MRVLVVDDSALVRKLLGQILAAEPDMEVRFARDGVEALDMLAEFAPDVITLDVHMPRMGGLACLDRIMLERPCPVVMVSSATDADSTLKALELGAVDVVAKPVGAISLRMHDMAPLLVAKVRAAAAARLSKTRRLRERVRHRMGAGAAPDLRLPPESAPPEALVGAGLVLIGASTGGPPALEAVLAGLPADFPWPVVVAQHMPASFTGALARRLDALCALTVAEVVDHVVLRPGTIHVGRGDGDVVIVRSGDRMAAMPAAAAPEHPWHPSADRLVSTAMQLLPARQLVGVLLTGMGWDGAAAMQRLHAAGGRTIAESEETAMVWGMPRALVKADGADWVLPLPRIGPRLRELLPGRDRPGRGEAPAGPPCP